ncbi:MAG TPA: guanylate kinase [Halalkalibaculum sp.]|nr:guanylate kinase [Halalkalibaculum sp.]
MSSSSDKEGKLIILVAPSGSGKTTIARKLLDDYSKIRFSVSATTRPPREGEENGKDYYFLSREEFNRKIEEHEFLEWEEFYNGSRYGTLRSEVDKLIESGYFPLLDIEVKGALNVKRQYGAKSVAIFIRPPSLEELKKRLVKRGSENNASLETRLERAEKELTYANKFDFVVINDDLDTAYKQVTTIVESFITE